MVYTPSPKSKAPRLHSLLPLNFFFLSRKPPVCVLKVKKKLSRKPPVCIFQSARARCARGVHGACTRTNRRLDTRAQGVHRACTGRAQGVHGACTGRARGVHGCTPTSTRPRVSPTPPHSPTLPHTPPHIHIHTHTLMWLHVVTCGYMWLHVVTCGYMWLHVVYPRYTHTHTCSQVDQRKCVNITRVQYTHV